MYNKPFFNIFIICSIFVMAMAGCERTDLQNSSPIDEVKITSRNNCPNAGDCHCVLTLTSGSGSFKLCGTTDGDAVVCEVEDPGVTCATIDGLEHTFFNYNGTNVEFFCMAENTGLEVSKLDGGSATLSITFQAHDISPQTLNMTFTGQGKKYFESDGDCVVAVCD